MPSTRRTVAVVAFAFLSACSYATPGSIASGEVIWGARDDQRLDWRIEASAGLSHAVSFDAGLDGENRGQRAVRLRPDDLIWWRLTTPVPESPTFVFGGADESISSVVVLVNGEPLSIDLLDVSEREWQAGIIQLPTRWRAFGEPLVEVVASIDGDEVHRLVLSPTG